VKIRTCNSSGSSKVIDLDANRKRIGNFLLVTGVTLDKSPAVFAILTHKTRKLFTSPYPCLMPLAEERPTISMQSTNRWKVHLVGYNYVAEIMSLSLFSFV